MADERPFLSRWAQRKAQARQGVAVPAEPTAVMLNGATQAAPPPLAPDATDIGAPHAPTHGVAESAGTPAVQPTAQPAAETPPPTLDDVARLTRDSDYAPFVARGVDPGVKNAALKKLFTDPHFNVMDGLDTYIDDYSKPDPLPPGMLRQMVQSQFLGLFDDEPALEPAPTLAPTPALAPTAPLAAPPADPTIDTPTRTPPIALDEDSDLRLQPNDAAGPADAHPGAGQDPRREH